MVLWYHVDGTLKNSLQIAQAASRSAFSEAQLVPEDIQWFGLYVAWCRGGDFFFQCDPP